MVNKDFYFSVLTDNCQAEHHDWSIEKDCWRSFPGESSVISLNSFRSSANNEFFTVPQHTSAIYLINKMKSMGPRTEPCGTPLWTLTQLEEQFSMTTRVATLPCESYSLLQHPQQTVDVFLRTLWELDLRFDCSLLDRLSQDWKKFLYLRRVLYYV